MRCFCKITAFILSLGIAINVFALCAVATSNNATSDNTVIELNNVGSKVPSIVDYLKSVNEDDFSNEIVMVDVPEKGVKLCENETVSFDFIAPEKGLYALKFGYTVLECQGQYPTISIGVNGEIPFKEANNIELMRRFKSKETSKENLTNDEIPEQLEIIEPITAFLKDTTRYYGDILYFLLAEGTNSVSITCNSETININSLSFENPKAADKYQSDKNSEFSLYDGSPIYIEGESADYKSDATLFPLNDASSPSVSPSSPYEKYLNIIGGSNWKNSGQYIEWEVDVPTDGLYKIAVKYRQNTNVGMTSSRILTIDGKIPFDECEEIAFPYSATYKNYVLSTDNEDILFPLSKGKHIIRLEVTIGSLKNILPVVEDIVTQLNNAYRRVIVITGSNPDTLRDYRLEEKIPDTIKLLEEQKSRLTEIKKIIEENYGSGSTGTKIIGTICEQLDEFIFDPFNLTASLGDFKSNISSLSNWLLSAKNQPLSIDYIALFGNEDVKSANKGFWYSLKFNLQSFLYTFTGEYSYVNNNEQTVNVWINCSTTAYSIAQQLIDSQYNSKKSDYNVDIKLVTASLITAKIAGKAPDVSLGLSDNEIMNLAFRNSMVDLTKFDDCNEVANRFRKSAITPVTYAESIYGIPLTENFNVLYYRTDVLDEIGVSVPQSWDDVISAMAALKKRNLEFGISSDINSFVTLLLQKEGNLYSEDLTRSAITTRQSIEAFEEFCSWFTEYKSPIAFDASQRFRTGEMPLVVADYGFCNSIEVLAPEIKGLWGMALLPATIDEDGRENRSVRSSSTYAVILNEEKSEYAWDFIKWWTSAEVQYENAHRLEMAMGRSVRVNLANLEAFDKLGYSKKEKELIYEQGKWAIGIENVPGGYYVSRYLGNALNKVLYNSEIPGDALYRFSKIIDEEIAYKREEFNMNTGKE